MANNDAAMPECDQLPEKIKKICRGENPNISIADVNRNRGHGFGGLTPPLPPLPIVEIASIPNTMPSLLIRGWNFTKAMAKWTLAGMPMRTQEQIDERLAICQSCPFLRDKHCSHPSCGCACNEVNQLLNKLAIATEKCPIGKWS